MEKSAKKSRLSGKAKIWLFFISLPIVSVLIIYGISRVDLDIKGKKSLYGSVSEKLWSPELSFDAGSYFSLTVKDGEALDILMLTDTHFNNGGWYANYFWLDDARNKAVYGDISKVVDLSDPDFIYITGDLLTDTLSDYIYRDFCGFMDAMKIPWTMTFGNHDAEWRADKAKLSEILNASKYCKFDIGYTNINGLGNTVIPIKDGNGSVIYALVLMDFGDWQKKKDPDKQYSTYEAGTTENQLGWYRWVIEGLKASAGRPVETMMLAHIPFHAVTYAAKLTYAGKLSGQSDKYIYGTDPFDTESEFGYETGEYKEFRRAYRASRNKGYEILTLDGYYEYKRNDEFFKLITELGSTKQIVSGHNHCDGYSVSFDGITYTSVVKTGSIYVSAEWDGGNRGGTLFKLENRGGALSVSSERLFV